MGWQKRGKGYNSSTGHAAVMGVTYGKVKDYTTRTKVCRVCTNAKKIGKEAKQHNCRLNHTASSKAMEPMAAVHLFTESLNSHVKLSVYVGDEDSTTYKREGPLFCRKVDRHCACQKITNCKVV